MDDYGPIETKCLGGHVLEHKQIDVNGVPVGVIEGYIATWEPDTGGKFGMPDRFIRGAFSKSLQEHRDRGNRQIRMKSMHGELIGGWPIETAREDQTGLFAVGHINLEKQEGREIFSLVRQGVVEDLSIGFSSIADSVNEMIRDISEAIVWEGSPVDEPANQGAQITEIKAAVPFQDLPLADRDRAWDSTAAIGRVRTFTDSEDAPTSRYRNAFVWYDRSDPDSFGSYKLPVADVIDGRLMAVPRGVFAAAGAMQGARGGVDIPDADRPGVIRHLERYYAKMDLESPFETEERRFISIAEAKSLDVAGLELALKGGVTFSQRAARDIAQNLFSTGITPADTTNQEEVDILRGIMDDIRDYKRILRSGRSART